mgnify:CR=1 FL=1
MEDWRRRDWSTFSLHLRECILKCKSQRVIKQHQKVLTLFVLCKHSFFFFFSILNRIFYLFGQWVHADIGPSVQIIQIKAMLSCKVDEELASVIYIFPELPPLFRFTSIFFKSWRSNGPSHFSSTLRLSSFVGSRSSERRRELDSRKRILQSQSKGLVE